MICWPFYGTGSHHEPSTLLRSAHPRRLSEAIAPRLPADASPTPTGGDWSVDPVCAITPADQDQQIAWVAWGLCKWLT
jgi:hypothetical protein